MIYKIGLLVAVVGSALAYSLEFADSFGMIKIGVALAGSIILWISASPPRFGRTGIEAPLAAFLAWFVISAWFSIDPFISIMGNYSQPFNGMMAVIPAVLIYYAANSEGWRWGGGGYYCAALIVAVNGAVCAAQVGGWIDAPYALIDGRALGIMGSPIFTGAVVAVCLPPAVKLASSGSWLGWAGSIGGFLALTACRSRGPWIASIFGLGCLLARSGAWKPRVRHFVALALILAAAWALWPRLRKAQSDSERFKVWGIAARAGNASPVFGWGPDTFILVMRQYHSKAAANGGKLDIQSHAHNDLLQAWATMGLPGLLALALLWIALFRSSCQAAVFGSLAALFVVAKLNPVPPSAVYIVAALAGAQRSAANRKGSSAKALGWALGFGAFMIAGMLIAGELRSEYLHAKGVLAFKLRGETRIAADLIRGANEMSPREIYFATRRCELIFKITPSFDRENQVKFARRALAVAALTVQLHPDHPSAYELMATSELFAVQYFGTGLARAALRSAKRASDLSPYSKFSLTRRMQAARIAGNEIEENLAAEEFAQIGAR